MLLCLTRVTSKRYLEKIEALDASQSDYITAMSRAGVSYTAATLLDKILQDIS